MLDGGFRDCGADKDLDEIVERQLLNCNTAAGGRLAQGPFRAVYFDRAKHWRCVRHSNEDGSSSCASAAAKARGAKLGNPNGAAALRRAGKGAQALRAAVTRNADAHAQALAPVIADLRARGHTTLRAIAAELEARGMQTRRGGRWHVSNVRNLLARLQRA